MARLAGKPIFDGKPPVHSSSKHVDKAAKAIVTATQVQVHHPVRPLKAGTPFGTAAGALRVPMSPASVIQLQRTVGNQAVTRLIQPRRLRPMVTVGAANDLCEREADQMAAQVVSMNTLSRSGTRAPEAAREADKNVDRRMPLVVPVLLYAACDTLAQDLNSSFYAGSDVEHQLTVGHVGSHPAGQGARGIRAQVCNDSVQNSGFRSRATGLCVSRQFDCGTLPWFGR